MLTTCLGNVSLRLDTSVSMKTANDEKASRIRRSADDDDEEDVNVSESDGYPWHPAKGNLELEVECGESSVFLNNGLMDSG